MSGTLDSLGFVDGGELFMTDTVGTLSVGTLSLSTNCTLCLGFGASADFEGVRRVSEV